MKRVDEILEARSITVYIALIGGAIAIWRSGDELIKPLIRKWTTVWNRTNSDLHSSFSGFHSFGILAGANLFGIILGRFLFGFLRQF